MSEITAWLALHGGLLLMGSAALLLVGTLAVGVVRTQVYRQRLGEMTIAVTLIWLLLAAVPLPRWNLLNEVDAPQHHTIAVTDDPAAVVSRPPPEDVSNVPVVVPAVAPVDSSPESADITSPQPMFVATPNDARADVSQPPKVSNEPTIAGPIDWPRIAAGAYLIGVGLCLWWLLLGRLVLAWRERAASEPDPWLVELYESLLPATNRCRARLLVSPRGRCPVSYGLLRPRIVLLADLCRPEARRALRHVLLHELAHVERRDARGHALLNLAFPVLFVHPLYWLLRRQVHFSRELIADDWAAGFDTPQSYAEGLIGWLRQQRAAPAGVSAGLGILGASPFHHQFSRRMKMLIDRKNPLLARTSLRWSTATVLAGMLVTVALASLLGNSPIAVQARAEDPVADLVAAASPLIKAKEEKTGWRALPGVGLGPIANVCFVDEKRAWMGMSDGSLLKTIDGGATWRTVELPRADDSWSHLQVRVLKRRDGSCFGWAITSTGRIYHTADGVKWTSQTPPLANVKHRIGWLNILDENHAKISGPGLNWSTADGGQTWQHLSPALTKNKTLPRWFSREEALRLVHFRDKNNGTALVVYDIAGWGVRTTSDGGKTWQAQKKRFPYKTTPVLTVFRSGRALRVYTDGGVLIYGDGDIPLDDGALARLLSRTSTTYGRKINPNQTRRYSVVSGNVIAAHEPIWGHGHWLRCLHISNNGGAQWSRRFLTAIPSALHFPDQQNGWAVGPLGRVIQTSDGGATWLHRLLPTDADFNAVYFLNAKIGWVGGGFDGHARYGEKLTGKACIWQTTDGGKSWRRLVQIENGRKEAHSHPETVNRLLFKNRREGWAVTHGSTKKPHPEINGATPTEYGRILHTLDGGRTWKQVYYGFPLKHIARRGDRWCVAGYGIAISSDGKKWKNVALHTISFAVAFADRDNVIAVGEAGGYAQSANGGSDWTLSKPKILQETHMDAIGFAGPNVGWIGGSAKEHHDGLFTTSNGGKTWQAAKVAWPSNFGPARRFAFDWKDISVADARHAWAIGSSYGRPIIFQFKTAGMKSQKEN